MRSKGPSIEERVLKEANYTIANLSTVRATAKALNVSKTTVHNDLTKLLPFISFPLYQEVYKIFQKNKKERAIRGGNAIRQKYLNRNF